MPQTPIARIAPSALRDRVHIDVQNMLSIAAITALRRLWAHLFTSNIFIPNAPRTVTGANLLTCVSTHLPGVVHQPFSSTHRGRILGPSNIRSLSNARRPSSHRRRHREPRRRHHHAQGPHELQPRSEAETSATRRRRVDVAGGGGDRSSRPRRRVWDDQQKPISTPFRRWSRFEYKLRGQSRWWSFCRKRPNKVEDEHNNSDVSDGGVVRRSSFERSRTK